MRPQIIRPQDNPEHAFPKAQVQESDGVEPGGAPYPGGERMLLDAYLDFSTPRNCLRLPCLLPKKVTILRPTENVLHCQKAGAESRNERYMKSRSPALLKSLQEKTAMAAHAFVTSV